MKFDIYGEANQEVIILIHGGPSLYGYMMSLGQELTDSFKVIDYAQRGSVENQNKEGDEKLTVEQHLLDLNEIVEQVSKELDSKKVILLGHSWGANLALLYAAKFPKHSSKVICLGTAALSEEMGDLFSENFEARISELEKTKLENINRRLEDSKTDVKTNEIMNERLSITGPLYHFDRKTEKLLPACKWNFNSFRFSIDSIWDLIEAGEVPSLLSSIKCPVISIHGDSDVFPADETFSFLERNITSFEGVLIDKAGHFPWLEKTSREQFYKELNKQLKK